MTIKGILFDKDGTLIDFAATWVPAYLAAVDRVAQWAGRREAAQRLLEIGGYDPRTALCQPGSVLACGTAGEIAILWSQFFDLAESGPVESLIVDTFSPFAAHPVPVTDLPPLLERLAARGLSLGVATSDNEALAHRALNALGASKFMDFVCGYDSGFGVKPGPGMVNGFCGHCGIDPGQVLVVGDSTHDLHMGRNAGAGLTVGVLSGTSPREVLEALADHVLADVSGLETLL